jgi:hypothetical protein
MAGTREIIVSLPCMIKVLLRGETRHIVDVDWIEVSAG